MPFCVCNYSAYNMMHTLQCLLDPDPGYLCVSYFLGEMVCMLVFHAHAYPYVCSYFQSERVHMYRV